MRVRVPASSANLGPGFDCFGLAWQLYNEMDFTPQEGFAVTGCDSRYQNADNLACRAYRYVLEQCGKPCAGLRIDFGRTEIPVSRGLGSSAALIAGGVAAANALNGLRLSDDELLALATQLEGHPDNVAPALRGGFTVSTMEGERVLSRSFPISEKLHFTVLIPPFELSTALSRGVLPQQVSRGDAIFNISRASLLIRALQDGDTALLADALADRIHQPYRFSLIQGYEQAKAAAQEAGAAGLCISGAGSTLLCIADSPLCDERLRKSLAETLPGWQVKAVLPERRGVTLF